MLLYRHTPAALLLIAIGLCSAVAQPIPPHPATTALPNMSCGQSYSPQWNNCVGTVSYPNGNLYRGEFHHGMREGFGVIAINATGVSDANHILAEEPSLYAGEFRGDQINGHGVWFTTSGAGYFGTYVNNIPQSDLSQENCSGTPSPSWSNCVGTIKYENGNVYRGHFMQGQGEGIGMLLISTTGASDATNIRTPVPGIYVGEFRGGRLNGRGMIFMPGAGFYGTFTDNIFISATALGAPGSGSHP